jgi:hypothetical protein
MTLNPVEYRFLKEWAIEWSHGFTVIGSARRATNAMGLGHEKVLITLGKLGLTAEEMFNLRMLPMEEVACPWNSNEEFERFASTK